MTPWRKHLSSLALAALGFGLFSMGCGEGVPAPGGDLSGSTRDGQLVLDAESRLRAELIQADLEFARSVRDHRLEGLIAAFDEDGMVLPGDGPIAVGPKAIRDLFASMFAEPSFTMTWVPVGSEVAASGDLGYTFGDWRTSTSAGGAAFEQVEGKYVTVWRKGADGRWRVLADIGNTQSKPTDDS